jgi:hypothetical protein
VKVSDARIRKRKWDELEKSEAIRKAKKRITTSISTARKALERRGINARKAERERLNIIKALPVKAPIPPDLLTLIRDP